MAREFAKGFYESTAWKKCRDSFFIYKQGCCDRCGGVGIIAHHKIWLTPNNINDPCITLSWDNLELLCNECHSKEHLGKGNTNDDCMFDDLGNLIRK